MANVTTKDKTPRDERRIHAEIGCDHCGAGPGEVFTMVRNGVRRDRCEECGEISDVITDDAADVYYGLKHASVNCAICRDRPTGEPYCGNCPHSPKPVHAEIGTVPVTESKGLMLTIESGTVTTPDGRTATICHGVNGSIIVRFMGREFVVSIRDVCTVAITHVLNEEAAASEVSMDIVPVCAHCGSPNLMKTDAGAHCTACDHTGDGV